MATQVLLPNSSFHFNTSSHARISPDIHYTHACQTSTMERRKSAMGSFRSLFSRKGSHEEQTLNIQQPSSTYAYSSNNPYRNAVSYDQQTQQQQYDSPPPAYNSMPCELEAPGPIAPALAPAPAPLTPQPQLSGLAPESISKRKTLSWKSRRLARQSSSYQSNGAQQEDEQFEFLRSFDTILLIDDSTSMTTENRWNEVSRVLSQLTPICTHYDSDGIDLRFLNTIRKPVHSNVTSSSTVLEIFSDVQPCGATPIGTRLSSILRPYVRQLETALGSANSRNGRDASPSTGSSAVPKPINIIIITDGEPTDDPESVIVQTARKLDSLEAAPWQIGIQFFQVGSNRSAKQYLEHLDDELATQGAGCRDIVDTVPYNGRVLDAETILKVVLGAVNRRLDRKRNASPGR